MFLIEFTYDHYCQGYEDVQKILLVYANSYDEACEKVRNDGKWDNPRVFKNLTLQ